MKKERVNIGTVDLYFEVPTIDPRNYDHYLLSIFSKEDDRTEIIDCDTLETQMIFTANNYVDLPTGERLGHLRSLPHDGDQDYTLLGFVAMAPCTLSIQPMLVKNYQHRIRYEAEIFKAYLAYKNSQSPTVEV